MKRLWVEIRMFTEQLLSLAKQALLREIDLLPDNKLG